MQIDYKTFLDAVTREGVRASRLFLDKFDAPGCDDRHGYSATLISAPTQIRWYFCRERDTFDYDVVCSYLKDKINERIGLVRIYRYSSDQHFEFARARGYLYVLRLLRLLAAQKIHSKYEASLEGEEEK